MADQQAILKTNQGDITVNLFPNHAPETVDELHRPRRGHQGLRRRQRPQRARSTTASASTGSSTAS